MALLMLAITRTGPSFTVGLARRSAALLKQPHHFASSYVTTTSCSKYFHRTLPISKGGVPPVRTFFKQSRFAAAQQSPKASTPGTEATDENEGDQPPAKLGLFARFKQMYKDYWYVLVPVHCLTSVFWFGGFYYASTSGVDVIAMLEQLGVSEAVINPVRDSSLGHIAIAYLLYKIATPARYTVTLGGTTISIKYLEQWGYIKPMPSKARLKQIITDKRDNLQERYAEKKQDLQDRYAERKQDLQERIAEKKQDLQDRIAEKKQDLQDKIAVKRQDFQERKQQLTERKNTIISDLKKQTPDKGDVTTESK